MIEMLLVMVILSLSVSLVAPSLFSQVKKYKIRNEVHQVKSFVRAQIDSAYFSGGIIEILLDGSVVKSDKEEIKLNYIYFDKIEIIIQPNQTMHPSRISYYLSADDTKKTMILNENM